MAKPENRTSFDLDDSSLRRLESLSKAWRVSRSEVVRRALERSERENDKAESDPIKRLRSYHAERGLSASAAKKYLEKVAENRRFWGGGE
jgi:predicted transcriptional regulator